MYYSVSPNLLLIPYSVFFHLSLFFSSISLKYLYSFIEVLIVFLYSFSEFSEHYYYYVLNYLPGKLFISISLPFCPEVFSCSLV